LRERRACVELSLCARAARIGMAAVEDRVGRGAPHPGGRARSRRLWVGYRGLPGLLPPSLKPIHPVDSVDGWSPSSATSRELLFGMSADVNLSGMSGSDLKADLR